MTNKALANRPKLVPLKDQAIAAIDAAGRLLITATRPCSLRRRLMQDKINTARAQYRLGRYSTAINIARSAHL